MLTFLFLIQTVFSQLPVPEEYLCPNIGGCHPNVAARKECESCSNSACIPILNNVGGPDYGFCANLAELDPIICGKPCDATCDFGPGGKDVCVTTCCADPICLNIEQYGCEKNITTPAPTEQYDICENDLGLNNDYLKCKCCLDGQCANDYDKNCTIYEKVGHQFGPFPDIALIKNTTDEQKCCNYCHEYEGCRGWTWITTNYTYNNISRVLPYQCYLFTEPINNDSSSCDGCISGDRNITYDTCNNNCGLYDNSRNCQCDPDCEFYGDCCPDKCDYCQELCPSDNYTCDGYCGLYNGSRPCQCDTECEIYGDCCPDKCEICPDTCTTPVETCDGYCGLYDANRPCQCDPSCEDYGDCCEDKCDYCPDLCGNELTCQNHCGEYDGNKQCQCDSDCEQFGDCCDDKCDYCPDTCVPPVETCEGRCGEYDGNKPCQCDSACVSFNDCCEDKCEKCPDTCTQSFTTNVFNKIFGFKKYSNERRKTSGARIARISKQSRKSKNIRIKSRHF